MLVVQEYVTADGYAADREGRFGFSNVIDDWSSLEDDQRALIRRSGLIVFGRRTYEDFIQYWPTGDNPIAPAINETPKAVLSTTLTSAPWGDWPAPTVDRGPIAEVIERLAGTAAPNDLLVWGSIELTRSLLAAKLVDELRLVVCPVLLGDGVTVVPADIGRLTMTRIGSTAYPNGATELVFRLTP